MNQKFSPVPSSQRKRLLSLIIFLFFLLALLIAQFYRLQIIEGNFWSEKARRQHFFVVKEPARRGTFYLNTAIQRGQAETSQKLVVDVQRYHLYIDPESIPEKRRQELSGHLGRLLAIEEKDQAFLLSQLNVKSRCRRLAMWLDVDSRQAIMQWWAEYARKHRIVGNALYFVADYQRSYPFGKLLGQVLHTVRNQKDGATQSSIPTGGLELYFDSFLKGREGKRLLMRSPRNVFERGEILSPPEDGADIYLTINHYLQAIAEEELEKGVKKCKAKSGWAVMMDPFSGEILALAQYPFFYPPDYQSFFNDSSLTEHTRIKSVNDAYEPGSVVKPLTISIALLANEELKKRGQAPLFDPAEKMACSNGNFAGRSRPLNDTHLHPYLNMNMAIQKSSNIYPARLVERIVSRLGAEWYLMAMSQIFGFGAKTGVELPSESRGLLPLIGTKHPNGVSVWSAATPYSLAMGYNFESSAIQLARAYCVLANGGHFVKPTLIRKMIKKDRLGNETVLLDNTQEERRAAFPKVLEKNIIDPVVKAMKFTTKPGGTGVRGDVRGYTECGKTSTSKKIWKGKYSEDLYRSSFIGIVPANKPVFVLAVTMDEPQYGYVPGIGKLHHGGTTSAPVFKEIAKKSLGYLGVYPDDPYGYDLGDPRCNRDKADFVKEARELQEMYQKWNIPNGN